MKLAMHILIHLPDCVKNWGPMKHFDTFAQEDFNGFLLAMIHGTHSYVEQIIFRFQIFRVLSAMEDCLQDAGAQEFQQVVRKLKTGIPFLAVVSKSNRIIGEIATLLSNLRDTTALLEFPNYSLKECTAFLYHQSDGSVLPVHAWIHESECNNDSFFMIEEGGYNLFVRVERIFCNVEKKKFVIVYRRLKLISKIMKWYYCCELQTRIYYLQDITKIKLSVIALPWTVATDKTTWFIAEPMW